MTVEESKSDTSSNASEVVARIVQCLSTLERTSEFSIGGRCQLPILPGLCIKGIGMIPLPITMPIAEQIKKVANPAPFGKGLETIVDEKVRKAWEINADLVSITHPDWSKWLSHLVDEIGESLEFGGKVSAIFYKALLYEEGGHFDFHKDTEKENKMFGTLVIQLPSICTGGRLVTRFKGKENYHDFGASTGQAPFASHFAAHYADVEHGLETVTSGFRFVLTYSLVWDSYGIAPSAEENAAKSEKLANLMMEYSKKSPKDCFGIPLDHEYTEKGTRGMGLFSLKGHDKQIYQCLNSINTSLPDHQKIRIFLVEMIRRVSYYGQGESYYGATDWHLSEVTIDFDNWIEDNGKVFENGQYLNLTIDQVHSIAAEEEGLSTDDAEWWGDIFDEEEEGYMGNEGGSKEEIYKRYALVVYPSVNEFKYFLSVSSPEAIVKTLLIEVKEGKANSNDGKFQCFLEKWNGRQEIKWSGLYRGRTPININDVIVEKAILYVTELKSLELALLLLDKIQDLLATNSFDKISFSLILQTFGWNALASKVLPILLKLGDFSIIKELLDNNLIEKTKETGDAIFELFINSQAQIGSRNIIAEYQTFCLWGNVDFLCRVAKFYIENLRRDKLAVLCNALIKDQVIIPITDIPLRLIVEKRLQDVTDRLAPGKPIFTWCRPDAVIPLHPTVTEFLRSNVQTMDYHNFGSIRDARYWASAHFDRNQYSAKAEASGTGKRSMVRITKTRSFHQQLCRDYQQLLDEKIKLEKLLHDESVTQSVKRQKIDEKDVVLIDSD